MDYSKLTLGELLSSDNQAIKRNAVGILKQLQKTQQNKKILSVIGNDDDLICVNCHKEKKMRMSAYCPKCKEENNRLTR